MGSLLKEEVFVEVVEIYPHLTEGKSEKYHEKGTCHVHLQIGDLSIEIKNVRYKTLKNGNLWMRMPGRSHADPKKGEGKQVFVPSITFNNKNVFTDIKEAIKKDLEKDFGSKLTEVENV